MILVLVLGLASFVIAFIAVIFVYDCYESDKAVIKSTWRIVIALSIFGIACIATDLQIPREFEVTEIITTEVSGNITSNKPLRIKITKPKPKWYCGTKSPRVTMEIIIDD